MAVSFILLAYIIFAFVQSSSKNSTGTVIFRLDDVQDYYQEQEQIEIIDAFIDKKAPLCIGVIGGKYFGQSKPMLDKVMDAQNIYGHEVFNHGDDAQTLFNEISKDEAKQHIQNGEFNGFDYSTFAPHELRWNEHALSAAKELGYTAFSGGNEGRFAMRTNLNGQMKILPQQAQTAECDPRLAPEIDQVIEKCAVTIASIGHCVVMMHPQEFHQSMVSLKELSELIDDVRKKGWKIMTFRDYVKTLNERDDDGWSMHAKGE